jgi:hypothetical protein
MHTNVQSHERPNPTILLPCFLLSIKTGPRRVRMQAFQLAALISTSHPKRIVEVSLSVHIERREPMHAAPRGLVCVHHKDSHVSRWWHVVARKNATPALSKMLASYPVDVARVGRAPPQKVGVLLVEALVPLAITMSAAFHEAHLSVHALSGEPET